MTVSLPYLLLLLLLLLALNKRDLFIWQKRPINISIPEVC